MQRHLRRICGQESFDRCGDDVLQQIDKSADGDVRRALTLLQSVYVLSSGADSGPNDLVPTPNNVCDAAGDVPLKDIADLVDCCLRENDFQSVC